MDSTGELLNVNVVARNWFLVVLHNTVCAERCQDLLLIAERIRIALGRDMHRLGLAMLAPEQETPESFEQNWILPVDSEFIDALRLATRQPPFDTALLIVDHQGIVVLIYPPSEEGPGVLSDLKRLLRATAR